LIARSVAGAVSFSEPRSAAPPHFGLWPQSDQFPRRPRQRRGKFARSSFAERDPLFQGGDTLFLGVGSGGKCGDRSVVGAAVPPESVLPIGANAAALGLRAARRTEPCCKTAHALPSAGR